MDHPPPQHVSLQVHPTSTTTTTIAMNHGPGSAESSPKSSNHADWDEPLAQVPGAKLRLMCSYGGHIIPRPHDKTLCYVGGETRMVVVERNSSLADLMTRLSRTLLDGRQFTLKYQLPNEELDSLISVTSDEDVENMAEEYDRIMNATSPLRPCSGRLRLFLFFAKPETAKTMGALLDDAKSDNWFVDALNGANLPRGLSDSAAMDDLLSLDSSTTEHGGHAPATFSDASAQTKNVQQDVHSIQFVMPDSPMIETNTSSFDSTTSSPSMAPLPSIRVRVDENGYATRFQDEMRAGTSLEEQLSSQLKVTPPRPTAILTPSAVAVTHATGGGHESTLNNRLMSDDEKSDHAIPVALRKPPLPLHLPPAQHRTGGGFNLPSPDSKHAGGVNLPSPDSVKSDSSIASAASFSKVAVHQEPAQVTSNENKTPITTANNGQRTDNRAPSPPNQNGQVQPIQDPTAYAYPPPHQQDQYHHQYIHPNMHYIPANPPMSSYYPVYAAQQPIQSQADHQQYPVYLLPVTQNQPYNMPIQPVEGTTLSSAVPPSSAAQAHQPVVYPPRAAALTNNPGGMVQITPNSAQYQQYVGHYNPQTGTQMPANTASYANYDYGRDNQQHHPLHHQMYYTDQPGGGTTAVPVAPSQYQSITPAQAAMIAEASMQLPTNDCTKHPPRTS